MHGEPNRRLMRVGPLDPVPPVGRDVEERPWPQFYRLLALESQPGRTLHEQDPLVGILVVPEALGRSVAQRDDPFDAKARSAGERLDKFLGQIVGDVGEEVREAVHRHFLFGRLVVPVRLASKSVSSPMWIEMMPWSPSPFSIAQPRPVSGVPSAPSPPSQENSTAG